MTTVSMTWQPWNSCTLWYNHYFHWFLPRPWKSACIYTPHCRTPCPLCIKICTQYLHIHTENVNLKREKEADRMRERDRERLLTCTCRCLFQVRVFACRENRFREIHKQKRNLRDFPISRKHWEIEERLEKKVLSCFPCWWFEGLCFHKDPYNFRELHWGPPSHVPFRRRRIERKDFRVMKRWQK